jgi:hypothetical protein
MGEQRRLRSEGRFAVKGRFGWKADVSCVVQFAAVPSSKADELKKLAELRDTGVLSEDEFTSQKLKLLRG